MPVGEAICIDELAVDVDGLRGVVVEAVAVIVR